MSDAIDLEARLDRLYAAPLVEFIALRNTLASELKAAGDGSGFDNVRARGKPSLPAWAVNRLFHEEPETFDELVEAGERLRQAQQSGDSAALSEAGRERRRTIEKLLGLAQGQLKSQGHALGAATLTKVERTLETIAVYGRSGLLEVSPGRLERELDPPGFEVLATLQSLPAVAPRPRRSTKAAPAPEAAGRTGAATKGEQRSSAVAARQPETHARARSGAELAQHRRAVARAEGSLEKARKRAAALRETWRQERDQAAELEEKAQVAQRQAEDARREADRAKARVRRGEAALERAELREKEARSSLDRTRSELESLRVPRE